MARGGGFLFRVVILPGSTLWALGVDWVTGLFSLWHNSAIHTLELHLSCYNLSISGSLSLGPFKVIPQKLPYLILANSYAWLQVRRNSGMKYSPCSLLRWIFANGMIPTLPLWGTSQFLKKSAVVSAPQITSQYICTRFASVCVMFYCGLVSVHVTQISQACFNHKITRVSVKQPWEIWVNKAPEFTRNSECIYHKTMYCQTCNIRHIKSEHLNIPHLIL